MKKLLLLLVCTSSLVCYAQPKRLSVNDKVPAFAFSNIVNGSFSRLDPATLSDKIILLDFWHTGCGACIHKMPLVSRLNKQFGRDLQIVMVTHQSKEEIEEFYSKHTDLRRLNIPTVVADSFFRQLFPHETNPHIAWIGKDRKVKAITEGEELTEGNISLLLKQNYIELPLKFDMEGFDYSGGTPFLQNSAYFPASPLAYSTLTPFNDNLGGSRIGVQLYDAHSLRVRAVNYHILNLFLFAWSAVIQFPSGYNDRRLVFSMRNKDLFNFSGSKENKFYCYELSVSKVLNDSLDKRRLLGYMRRDLEQLFRVNTRVQDSLTNCYVLSATGWIGANDSLQQPLITEFIDSTHFEKIRVKQVARTVEFRFNFDCPVVFEGQGDKLITTTLKNSYSSFEELVTDLKQSGLIIRREKRIIPMLVFTDAD